MSLRKGRGTLHDCPSTILFITPRSDRLDQKHKELLQQKEELLKESKAKLATMETVKAHIDTLMKVGVQSLCSRDI